MKRFLCILLICLMITPALAESIDLSAMSFDELRTLQTSISKELVTRPEWKSIPVPAGFYQVGVDIPAGKWCLKCGKSTYGYVSVRYGKHLNAAQNELEMPWDASEMISENGEGQNPESWDITLSEGYWLQIQYGQVIFTTPEKIDLGF